MPVVAQEISSAQMCTDLQKWQTVSGNQQSDLASTLRLTIGVNDGPNKFTHYTHSQDVTISGELEQYRRVLMQTIKPPPNP